MRTRLTRLFALSLALALAPLLTSAALAQDNSQTTPQYPSQDAPSQGAPQDQQGNPPPDNSQAAPPDNSQAPNMGQQPAGAGYQAFTSDQLDNLLAPIALYPDPLLAQVFVASTFPDQVEEAARYVRASGANGIDDQNWDVSVRSVAHYPTVIEMMADKIDWTTSLGQAYVNQSTDVASAVQRLRHEARKAGNLQTTPQQEVLENGDYLAINPYSPQYLYVPVYDPAIIYFHRPYWGPAITFGFGFPIGGWLNLGFHWGWGGGFGGVFYTGWNPLGWGRGCWNCGWIGRSRGFVNFHNNVYVNNRFNNININRGVVNRSVNVNNLNRYNSIHRNTNYNNVAANNARANRSFANNRGVQNNGARSLAANNNRPPGNANLNRNIANNSRADDFRGRENTAVNNRAANAPQNRGVQQAARPETRSVQQNSAPHAFGKSEGNFNARQSSQRGQVSRQQAQHSAPHVSAPHAPSHGGGGGSHGSSKGGGGGHSGGGHGGGGKHK